MSNEMIVAIGLMSAFSFWAGYWVAWTEAVKVTERKWRWIAMELRAAEDKDEEQEYDAEEE